MARQSGRAASAGGHHGGPHWATRRSHPDSPESGAAPTLRPVAAQMTVTKRISDALFPRGFEVASPPGVFSRHGSLPRAYADQCIHAGRSFFFSPSKGFFFRPQRNNSRRQQQRSWSRSGTTADGSSLSEAGGGADGSKYLEARNQVILGLKAMDSVPQENEINTARRSNALLTCRLVVF